MLEENRMVGRKAVSLRPLLLVLLGLVLLLVACTGEAEEDEAVADDAEVVADEAEEGEVAEEEIVLTFWMQQDNRLVEAMEGLIASFEEAHPTIDVQLDSFPFSEYHQKIATAFAGNEAPDVFWMDVRTASFAEQGALLPLDQYLTEELVNDYLPSTWEEPTYDGVVYGIPMHQLTEALYVNTEMAEAAGIELPTTIEEAWTWDEFVEVANALTVREGDTTEVWGFGVQRMLQDWSVLPVVYQNEGRVLSPELDEATGYLNSAETVEALDWYGDLFTEHQVIAVEPIPEGFETGSIAIFQAPSTFRPVLERDFPDLDYTVVPLFRKDACAVMTGGWNVSIAATTEHPEAAWEFVQWITGEKHREWVEASGYLPARLSVIEEMEELDEYPLSIFMEELTECPATRPAVPEYTFFFDTFKQAITDIAIGADPEETLTEAAVELDAELGE